MPRPTVFISYSHRDENWKDRLVRQLNVLEREDLLDVWNDRRIRGGGAWQAEIEAAMARARVAVLLVSADFLSSDFVRGEEVPRLLERRATEGLEVIPMLVWPCDWQAVPWLAEIELRPQDGRPLSAGNEHQIEEDLAALAAEIRELLKSSDPTPKPVVATADLGLRDWPPPALPAEPYPLLLPYDHPELLAGRDRELEALRRRFERRIPILGLYAPSGAGKSSLLAAGLVPALRAEDTPVAFDRHPREAGLGERLVGSLLAGPEGERPSLGEDPHEFVALLAKTRGMANGPPLLVLDQFEDALLPDEHRARAELGVLLASTVRAQMDLDEPPCRWLLAYREEFHGKVTTWLEDVLRDARRAGAAVEDLPYDLAGQERFHSWALPMLGAPPPGDDRAEEAIRAFQAAIERPLTVHEDGLPRYPWRFADDGARRLARAFAEARLNRPDAALAPELQVVLAHLLEAAGDAPHEGVIDVVVPEDPEPLIAEALADHLRKVLKQAFRAGSKAAARRGRTRALLALRELADAHGRRGEGIGASRLASAIGEDGEAIAARLAAPGARLIVAREDDEDPSGKRYALSHDRMAEAIVQAVEDEGIGVVPVDRELLRLRKLVALNTELYRARAVRQATDLDRKQFRGVRDHAEALLWDGGRREWWRVCRQKRTRKRQAWSAWATVIMLVLAVTGWRWWRWEVWKKERDLRLVEVATEQPTRVLDALQELIEMGADRTLIAKQLRRRPGNNLFAVFEAGPIETQSLFGKRIEAAETLLPSLQEGKREDLELMGVLAWALDDVAARVPALADTALDLRQKVLEPFNPPERTTSNDREWRFIPGGPTPVSFSPPTSTSAVSTTLSSASSGFPVL